MSREGLAELQEVVSLPGGDSGLFLPWLGYAYARSGKRTEAIRVIEVLKTRAQESFSSPSEIAAVYCGLAEKDQALAWLERAYQERDPFLPDVMVEPAFDPLRSDPHFQGLEHRMRLPPKDSLE